MKYVRAHILDVPYHTDFDYTYGVSSELEGDIREGALAIVPFGQTNRHATAVVTAIEENTPTMETKCIVSLLNECFWLDGDMLALCRFMKEQTLCTIGEAVKCIVPAVMATKVSEVCQITDKTSERLSTEYAEIYAYVRDNEGVTVEKLRDKFPSSRDKIDFLLRNKYISKRVQIEEKDKGKYENVVSLAISKEEALSLISEEAPKRLRSKKHAEILRLLCEFDTVSDKDLYERTKTQRPQLVALLEKGFLRVQRVRVMRDPYLEAKRKSTEDVILNDEQTNALETLKELYSSNEPR